MLDYTQNFIQNAIGKRVDHARAIINDFSGAELIEQAQTDFIDKVVAQSKIGQPTLEEGKLSFQLENQRWTPNQMPGGTSFTPGQMFDVDVAYYSVPFFIPASLEGYMPGHVGAQTIKMSLGSKSFIKLGYTRHKKADENDVESFKENYIRDIGYIKSYFSELEAVADRINSQSEAPIRRYFESRVNEAKGNDDLQKRMNPYS